MCRLGIEQRRGHPDAGKQPASGQRIGDLSEASIELGRTVYLGRLAHRAHPEVSDQVSE
jgi:hypothetical protein